MGDETNMAPDHSPDEAGDDHLLEKLRAVAREVDRVPGEVVEAAKAGWTWRTIDAELAELTYDSWADQKELAGVRGVSAATPTSRLLSFEATSVAVELEVMIEAGERRLMGQLVPGRPGVVEVHHRRGVEAVEADAVGRFTVASVAAGLFRLTVRPSGDPRAIATAWIQV
ncbi:MAG: hypothetical protein ACRD29_20445 [Acidimicrobiales bacterium]